MSTFNGVMSEYPTISVDCFMERNLSATAYFLSHCHLDHMQGFFSDAFRDRLLQRPGRIYCSEFTALLLRDNVRFHLSDIVLSRLEPLSIEFAHVIEVVDEELKACAVAVTLIPAGHCPGSVMFLVDGSNGRVLYTGDFRLYSEQIARCLYLRSLTGSVSTVYLDTTFCIPEAKTFVTREECMKALSRRIKKWISKNPLANIHLQCPANFGYEAVFVHLVDDIKQKVHVTDAKYGAYENTADILCSLTVDACSTKLHACSTKSMTTNEACATKPENLDLHIKLCAQAFARRETTGRLYLKLGQSLYKYCFSTHCSLTELRDFIQVLQPRKIIPCAIPVSSDAHKGPIHVELYKVPHIHPRRIFRLADLRVLYEGVIDLTISLTSSTCLGSCLRKLFTIKREKIFRTVSSVLNLLAVVRMCPLLQIPSADSTKQLPFAVTFSINKEAQSSTSKSTTTNISELHFEDELLLQAAKKLKPTCR